MPDPVMWNEVISPKMIEPSGDALTEWQMSTLWAMFVAISTHWELDFAIELLRSRWLDMVEALSVGTPDYRGEYANAANVFDAMVGSLGEADAVKLLYGTTIVTKPEDATTRLGHAKFFVANDFIRCFVSTGGFRGFVPKARNYSGFMGGSRFREWAPVRTGQHK